MAQNPMQHKDGLPTALSCIGSYPKGCEAVPKGIVVVRETLFE